RTTSPSPLVLKKALDSPSSQPKSSADSEENLIFERSALMGVRSAGAGGGSAAASAGFGADGAAGAAGRGAMAGASGVAGVPGADGSEGPPEQPARARPEDANAARTNPDRMDPPFGRNVEERVKDWTLPAGGRGWQESGDVPLGSGCLASGGASSRMAVLPPMKKRTIVRVLLGSLAVLTVATLGVYLFRWPIFGGTIRAKFSELAGKELNADAHVEILEGSLPGMSWERTW